jgi:hypothetical protein
MTPTMQFTTVHSRQLIDKALFSFGTLNDNGNTFYGYRVSCVGEGFIDSEHFMPLAGTELQDFINDLEDLKNKRYKQRLKMKTGSTNINFHFKGEKSDGTIKVITYITGFLFFSSASFFCATIKPAELERLIDNLSRCVAKPSHCDL